MVNNKVEEERAPEAIEVESEIKSQHEASQGKQDDILSEKELEELKCIEKAVEIRLEIVEKKDI